MIQSLPAALGAWYGDPLTPEQATALAERGRHRAQQTYRHGIRDAAAAARALAGELEQLIGEFWLDGRVAGRFDALARSAAMGEAGDSGAAALVGLVHGQLSMSCRLSDAMAILDAAFELGRGLFQADDFFTVMHRHELLRELPLHEQARAPAALAGLLNEATIIQRLRGDKRRPYVLAGQGDDTLG